jgi:GT2 family glycosyltransferase
MVMGACLWIPKKLWDELGGFPEWFGSIGEDLYLCCLARLWGYPVRALGVSGYRHHVGKSFGGGKISSENKLVSTFARRKMSERNKTFVLVMIYPTPFMQILLPVHLVLLMLEGVLLSVIRMRLSYLTRIYLPVFGALLRRRGSMVHGRHAAMAVCCCAGNDFFDVFEPLPYKLKMLLKHGLPEVR